MGREIGRGIYLVNGPFIFDLVRLNIRYGESSMLNSMCQLEYNADQETCHNCCNKKPDHPGTHSDHIYRKRYKYESMYHFENPEIKMIHQAIFFKGTSPTRFLKYLL